MDEDDERETGGTGTTFKGGGWCLLCFEMDLMNCELIRIALVDIDQAGV